MFRSQISILKCICLFVMTRFNFIVYNYMNKKKQLQKCIITSVFQSNPILIIISGKDCTEKKIDLWRLTLHRRIRQFVGLVSISVCLFVVVNDFVLFCFLS